MKFNLAKNNFFKKNIRKIDITSLFFLIVLDSYLFIQFLVNSIKISPYLIRDLTRTDYLLSGIIPFVGPDTLYGGFLPGNFFYILTLPYSYFDSNKIISFIIYSSLLRAISNLYSCIVVSEKLKISSVAVFFLINLFFGISIFPYINLNNASFIPLVIPFLITALVKYYFSKNYSKYYLIGFAILLGFAIQIHLTFILFIAIGIICILTLRKHAF